jgi:hypothetical protein
MLFDGPESVTKWNLLKILMKNVFIAIFRGLMLNQLLAVTAHLFQVIAVALTANQSFRPIIL